MFQFLKFGRLAGALKSGGPDAYSAVLELGQIGGPKAVELLVEALSRVDGVPAVRPANLAGSAMLGRSTRWWRSWASRRSVNLWQKLW